VADAEALPYPDASFDVVLSTFGVMFAPDHEQAASELHRVCRPGGRIGLACWTPPGFLGQLFQVVARYVPPVPGVRSPLLWGTDAHIQDLFAGAATIAHAARHFAFRYHSPEHWVDVLWASPQTFAALDANAGRTRAIWSRCCGEDRGGAVSWCPPGDRDRQMSAHHGT
jgi:SAM-dependent methyltransferase